MASLTRRMKDLTAKYGKVAVGVHLSVSALCFTGCYVAIKSSLHVENLLARAGLFKLEDIPNIQDSSVNSKSVETGTVMNGSDAGDKTVDVAESGPPGVGVVQRQGSNELNVVGGGGALALAFLCNKALFPVRFPLTFALTPPIWRFLVSRGFKV